MTNPTPHGQVPEALIDLIDAYAETRYRYGGIYNAKTEAARKTVIEALSGVQALSAGPGASRAAPPSTYVSGAGIHAEDGASAVIRKLDARFHDIVTFKAVDAAASPTPPAEQQAATKAAPVEQDDHQILAITTAYEQGVGKGHQAYNSGKEIANPYSPAYRCDLAWQYGYKEGKEQAQREAKAAPQPEAQKPVAWLNPWRADQVTTDYDAYGEHGIALYTAPQPAPLSDDVVRDAARWRMAVLIGNEVMMHPDKRTHATAVKAYMDATHSGLDLTGAVDAALAAQGGK